MVVNITNYAVTEISDVGGLPAGDTSLTVISSAGFPTPPFIARATQYNGDGDVIAYEFLRVTSWTGTGNTQWTVTRAQESTSDIDHPKGTQISNPVTKGVMDEKFILVDNDTYYDPAFKRLTLGAGGFFGSYRLGVGGNEANNQIGAGVDARAHIFNANTAAVGRIAELTFGAAINSSYAGIHGELQSAASNTSGALLFSVRKAVGDANLTEVGRFEHTTGQLLLQDGAVALPIYSFKSDPDTGIYRPGANIIGFSTLGTEQMRILDSGGLKFFYAGTVPAGAGSILGVGTEFVLGTGTTGSGLRSTINRYAWDVAHGGNIITDVYINNVSGVNKRIAQLDILIDDEGSGSKDGGHWVFYTTPTGGSITERFQITSQGNIILGTQSVLANAATVGFPYIRTVAGTPSGTPAGAYGGHVPMVYDTTANKIWVYNGAWRGVVVA